MRYFITSYFEIEGLHSWPGVVNTDCSEQYLQNPHRHIFKFRMKIPVTHTDRDVEFIQFAHDVKKKLYENFYNKENNIICNFGKMSCEQLGVFVLENFSNVIECEVTEDGESGAIICRQ